MMPADDVADSIIVRFPKAASLPVKVSRRSWSAFSFWLVRRMAESIGWLAVLGALTTWL